MDVKSGPDVLPRLEPAVLAIVSIGRKEHLGLDEDDAVVQDQDAAIVANVAMHHRHANVAENVLRYEHHIDTNKRVPFVASDLRMRPIASHACRNVSDSRK